MAKKYNISLNDICDAKEAGRSIYVFGSFGGFGGCLAGPVFYRYKDALDHWKNNREAFEKSHWSLYRIGVDLCIEFEDDRHDMLNFEQSKGG